MTDKSGDKVGHLNTILARGGVNLNDSIFKSSNARGLSGGGGGGMLKFRVDRRITFCFMLQLFAYAAQEHSAKYGSTLEQCAKIAFKNHKHSIHNPHASLRKEIPLKRICESKMICKPITLTMSAPTADGSAAAVVCSRDFIEFRGMQVSFKFAYMRAKT